MSESEEQFKFDQLLGLFIEDQIDADQLKDLKILVSQNPDFAKQLQQQLKEDQILTLYQGHISQNDDFVEKLEFAIQNQNDEFSERVVEYTRYNSIKKPNRVYQIALLATAACLCLAIFYIVSNLIRTEEFNLNVALVTHFEGESNLPLTQGDSLQPGVFELKSGMVDLTFYRGARLSVVAPAKLEIIDHMSVKCLEGRIRAIVPAVAKGFTVYTPDSKVIDLGTEFGMEVSASGESKVHVFDGEVEAYNTKDKNSDKRLIVAGQSLKPATGEIAEANLGLLGEFSKLSSARHKKEIERAKRWEELHERHLHDPRLLVYYDFEHDENSVGILKNKSQQGKALDAAMVGTMWSTGPWMGKSALEFVKSSDRLRIYVPGEHRTLTLACWVRVDSLMPELTSLMLSDGYEAGDLHWQINQSKTIQLGLRQNQGVQKCHAENHFTRNNQGNWTHLAVTIDLDNKVVKQFKNGRKILEKKVEVDTPVKIGYASIGNWDNGKSNIGYKNFMRNLNGAMAEFMIYNTALTGQEIKELALLKMNDSKITYF